MLVVAVRDDGKCHYHDNRAMVKAKSDTPHGVSASREVPHGASVSSGVEHAKVALVEVAANHQDHTRSAVLVGSTISALASKMKESNSLMAIEVWILILGLWLLCLIAVCVPCCRSFLQRLRKKHRKRHIVNGRVVYEWSQSASTITLYSVPPPGSENSLEVIISPDRLKIGREGKPAVMDWELFAYINADASSWVMNQAQGELEVCLTKVDDTSWPCVFKEHLPTAAKA